MSKINVLVIPSDRTGVSKFRSVDPHLYLQKMYPDDFWVDIDYEPKLDDENFLKKYQIIHYHRSLSPDYNRSLSSLPLIKKLGIVDIMDLDDYWLPNREHPAFMLIKQNGMDKMILKNLQAAGHVTTTTPIFASEIKTHCDKVFVLPNAVDPSEKQFKPNYEKSDKVRVGWLGGSSHMADLEILNGIIGKLGPAASKSQFVLCGFDTRGSVTMINQETGEQTQRPITPKESVWFKYEQIFTDSYRTVNEDYKKYLMEFKRDEYTNNFDDLRYRRVWTRPITTYAENYNRFDISLAPLKHHTFNRVKSQLKVIEAGFHKKALIAQDFGPYQIDCINAMERGGKINEKGNALLVEKTKNHKLWGKYTKLLINNPDLRQQLGENLYNDVQPYHIKNVTAKRAEIYKELVRQKNK